MPDSTASYTLERSPDGVNWTLLKVFDATGTFYDDASPLIPTDYYRLTETSVNGLTIPHDLAVVTIIPPTGNTPGTLVKARGITSTELVECWCVGTDSIGAMFVAGDYRSNLNDGANSDTAQAGYDAFLCKFTPAGEPQWLRTLKAAGDETIRGLAVDSGGNVIVTGQYSGTIDCGNGFTLTSQSTPFGQLAPDIFVIKYDPNNVCLWAKSFGSQYNDTGYALVSAPDGSIYLGAAVSGNGPATFGSITVPVVGNSDFVVVKLDSSGTPIWVKRFGTNSFSRIHALAVDKQTGSVYATGEFSEAINLGGGPVSAIGAFDFWIAKYDTSDGHYLWGTTAGDAGGFGLDTDLSTGNLYVTGNCAASTNFGTGAVNGGYYLASYSAGGILNWVQAWGASGLNDHGYGVAVGNNIVTIVGQAYASSPNFGGGFLIGNGNPDIYIASFNVTGNSPPTFRWAYRAGVGMNGVSSAVAAKIDINGNVVLTGTLRLTVKFDNNTQVSAIGAQTWAYLAQYTA